MKADFRCIYVLLLIYYSIRQPGGHLASSLLFFRKIRRVGEEYIIHFQQFGLGLGTVGKNVTIL